MTEEPKARKIPQAPVQNIDFGGVTGNAHVGNKNEHIGDNIEGDVDKSQGKVAGDVHGDNTSSNVQGTGSATSITAKDFLDKLHETINAHEETKPIDPETTSEPILFGAINPVYAAAVSEETIEVTDQEKESWVKSVLKKSAPIATKFLAGFAAGAVDTLKSSNPVLGVLIGGMQKGVSEAKS